MTRTFWLLVVGLLGCGTSVAPADGGADARPSRVGQECSGSPCGPNEFCHINGENACRATVPMCELRGPYCDPNVICALVPCVACVAAALACPAGTRCVHEPGRNRMNFYDAYCSVM